VHQVGYLPELYEDAGSEKYKKTFGEISSRVCFQSKCAGSAEWGDARRHDAGRQMSDAAMSTGG